MTVLPGRSKGRKTWADIRSQQTYVGASSTLYGDSVSGSIYDDVEKCRCGIPQPGALACL